jgi:hypothetical protein
LKCAFASVGGNRHAVVVAEAEVFLWLAGEELAGLAGDGGLCRVMS